MSTTLEWCPWSVWTATGESRDSCTRLPATRQRLLCCFGSTTPNPQCLEPVEVDRRPGVVCQATRITGTFWLMNNFERVLFVVGVILLFIVLSCCGRCFKTFWLRSHRDSPLEGGSRETSPSVTLQRMLLSQPSQDSYPRTIYSHPHEHTYPEQYSAMGQPQFGTDHCPSESSHHNELTTSSANPSNQVPPMYEDAIAMSPPRYEDLDISPLGVRVKQTEH